MVKVKGKNLIACSKLFNGGGTSISDQMKSKSEKSQLLAPSCWMVEVPQSLINEKWKLNCEMLEVLQFLIKWKVKVKSDKCLCIGVGTSISGKIKIESDISNGWKYFNSWSNEKSQLLDHLFRMVEVLQSLIKWKVKVILQNDESTSIPDKIKSEIAEWWRYFNLW